MNKYTERVHELGGRFIFGESICASEEELGKAEEDLGYLLPDDYRHFVQCFGGWSLSALYPIDNGPEGIEEGSVGLFFGLGGDHSYKLIPLYHDDLQNKIIAPEMLPITGDEFGKICLFLAGPRQGEVHLWYDAELTAMPYDYTNLYFIAPSFDEFMNLLCPIPE